MLNEHGTKSAKLVVTPVLARNNDDEGEKEASTEEHRIMRRTVGKNQFQVPSLTLHSPRTSGEVLGKTLKIRHHCVETSLARSVWCGGFRAKAPSTTNTERAQR